MKPTAPARPPVVTWHTARKLDPVAVELLRRAFRRHLRADFRIAGAGNWLDGAIQIDNDEALRMHTRGCLDLIEDTLHEAKKVQAAP